MCVGVLGFGLSGRAVFEYLNIHNIDCKIIDYDKLKQNNFDESYFDEIFVGINYLVVSPGINLNKLLKIYLKKKKIAFYGELEFASSKIKNDIIAVTGTNGKTTTVNLIFHLLKSYSVGVFLGGNIGVPATCFIDKLLGDELLVLECSSFQLETIRKFRPHVAVILNLTEDHLNRHRTMREYIRCKYKITKNQTKSDFLILNADDELIRKNPPKTKAQIFYFSTKAKVIGAYLKRNAIYFYDGETEIRLVFIAKIKLKGEHNLSNILASILSVYLQTRNVSYLKNIFTFQGVEHRIEFVKKICGVEFYNDSKATNISSVLVACRSFKQNLFLILGGSDKGYSFDELFENLPKNVVFVAIFGETKHKIAFSADKFKFLNYQIFDTLDESTRFLFSKAKSGDVVLLSPACASFDQFSNFEERGKVFKNIVMKLVDESCINS